MADPRSGSCGTTCPGVQNGAAECKDGTCVLTSCTPPMRSCPSGAVQTCNVNIQNDRNNCGFCGNACAQPSNGSPACVNGMCTTGACMGTFRDCNDLSNDGCEINIASNTAHCGACNNPCPALDHAASTCTQGRCGLGACMGTYANCNNSVGDGCEADLQTSPNNCDSNDGNGCESTPSTDPLNCGSCRSQCRSYRNASSMCSSGLCSMGACNTGYTDCNRSDADGCETQTGTDPLNCGACGTRCDTPANATSASCSNGACVATCLPSMANCDGSFKNGCETLIENNINNCGKCGQQCAGNRRCLRKSCIL